MVDLASPLARVLRTSADDLTRHFDMQTVGDLMRHYPRRYARRGELTELATLRGGEHVTVVAEIRSVSTRRMKNRPGTITEVVVTDGSGVLTLTFFKQPWRQNRLHAGQRGLFSGQVTLYGKYRKPQLAHPDMLLLEEGQSDAAEFIDALIPVYPATANIPSWKIARTIRVVLDLLDDDLPDPIPPDVREPAGLLPLREALVKVHRPRAMMDAQTARHRFKWEEAFVLQAALAQRRLTLRTENAVPRAARPDRLLAAFDASLPFPLTGGQQQVSAEILADIGEAHPMHRLLQGEVGSGKTVVALRAMLAVVDAGGQAALLAPTEVLAQQHVRSIRQLLGPLALAGQLGGDDVATRVELLTGSLGGAGRREALAATADGSAGIVVGTHALLEEGVSFADLGLVVVDEQHRFGVEQRDALRAKGDRPPHVLVMTATPIPRTVAMTVYGDLEVSTLAELPPGRSPVTTNVVPVAEKPTWLERAWTRVREEVAAGHQAYVVCPRIGGDEEDVDAAGPADESEPADEEEGPRRPAAAVLDVEPMLRTGPLAGLRVGVLHGRLPADDKDEVMRAFAAGAVDVLVATTVVEVGVDVPNATVMVVLDADRFGVSQLHQLRGRVGRGAGAGLCLLVTDDRAGTPARERLAAVAETTDGFVLARLDLAQRREGDVLGTVQAGRRSSLRLLSLLEDEDLILAAREAATATVAADPALADRPGLAAAIDELVGADRAEYLEKA